MQSVLGLASRIILPGAGAQILFVLRDRIKVTDSMSFSGFLDSFFSSWFFSNKVG